MRRTTRLWSLFTLIIGALIFAAWMWCARTGGKGWSDDMPYSRMCLPGMDIESFFTCTGPLISSLSDVLSSIAVHFTAVNGRLASALMFVYVLLPGWCGVLLQGTAYALMIAGLLRLGLGKDWKSRPLAILLLIILVWIVFLWDDMYGSAAFMFNYVWSSAGLLWSLIIIFDPEQSKHLRWLCLIIPAAMMHEAASATGCVAIIASYLINGRHKLLRDKRQLILPLIFILFSVVPLLSPALYIKIESGQQQSFSWDYMLYRFVLKNLYVFLVSGIFLIYAVRKRKWCELCIYESMVLINIVIVLISMRIDRAFWYAYLAATVMLLLMCKGWNVPRRLHNFIYAVSLGALIWWGVELCLTQWRCSMERNRVVAELKAHPDQSYTLTPVTNYASLPWWLMGIPATVGEMPSNHRNYIYKDAVPPQHRTDSTFIPLPAACSLQESMASLPELPGGMRGNKYVIISRDRIPNSTLTLIFSAESVENAPGVNPVYNLRKYRSGEPIECRSWCEEVVLTVADSTLYLYRPCAVPRSLWSHKLISCSPSL